MRAPRRKNILRSISQATAVIIFTSPMYVAHAMDSSSREEQTIKRGFHLEILALCSRSVRDPTYIGMYVADLSTWIYCGRSREIPLPVHSSSHRTLPFGGDVTRLPACKYVRMPHDACITDMPLYLLRAPQRLACRENIHLLLSCVHTPSYYCTW